MIYRCVICVTHKTSPNTMGCFKLKLFFLSLKRERNMSWKFVWTPNKQEEPVNCHVSFIPRSAWSRTSVCLGILSRCCWHPILVLMRASPLILIKYWIQVQTQLRETNFLCPYAMFTRIIFVFSVCLIIPNE